MSNVEYDVECWGSKDYYNATHAAYLFMGKEPQEGMIPTKVKEMYQDLIDHVQKDIVTHGKKVVYRQKISDERSKVEPYWRYKRADLQTYAEGIGIRPLFLFPEDLNGADNLNKKQDNSKGGSESNSKEEIPNHNSTEEADIKRFIEGIVKEYPDATSKDIISHCFECYPGNRQKNKVKDIMKEMGIKMSGSGKRSKEAVAYMAGAPKYKPT